MILSQRLTLEHDLVDFVGERHRLKYSNELCSVAAELCETDLLAQLLGVRFSYSSNVTPALSQPRSHFVQVLLSSLPT
jgi:hypothetical protein